jgi:hypothetical protein
MTAGAAFEANIRTQAGNIPLVPAAWMWFAQAHSIVKLKVWEHNSTQKLMARTLKIIP